MATVLAAWLSSTVGLKINSGGTEAQQTPEPSCAVPSVFTLPDIDVKLRSGDALTATNWHNAAIVKYNEGAIDLAIQHQIMATSAFPYGAPVWSTLAMMLVAKANYLEADHADRLPLLCETVAAIELAGALSNDQDQSLMRSMENALGVLGQTAACVGAGAAPKCFQQHCLRPHPIYARARATLLPAMGKPQPSSHFWHAAAPQQGWHRIATSLCRPNATEMTVRPASLEAQRGVLSAVSAFETYMLWKVCGVVALADTFDLSIVERTRSHVVGTILEEHTSAINKYRDAVQSGRPLSGLEGEKFASRDNTKASLRFELKLPHDTPPYADRGLVDNELVRFVVKLLLLDNMVTLDTFSAVVALPQCPSMHWHRDVSDPFRRWATSSVEAPTPAPGLVAVVPLVNVSQQTNGPTEFLMGSHVVSDGRWDTDDGDGAPIDAEVRPLHLALDALAGSAVLFDLRLRHRGGANPSEDVRPVLYLGFALSWFADGSVSNFQTAHTARWAREPSATRRALYSRLDTAEYTRRLESELQQRGVDLGELKARGEATAANPVAGTQLHL